MFRNDKNFRFTGKIHEQVADSILKSGHKIFDSNITINHYGYIGKNIEKEKRNKVLLEQENKNDIFMQYHLANTYFSMQELDKALTIYLEIITSAELSLEQIEDVKIKTAQIYLTQNEYQKVIHILNFTANNIDNEGLLLSILGTTYLQLKDFNKAKEYYSNPAVSQSKLVNPTILENVNKVFNILYSNKQINYL
jgi:tetratricopeptide (TPR) repeat protein